MRLVYHATVNAIAMAGVESQIFEVTHYAEIAARRVLDTPGLVIDGEVESAGRVSTAGDLAQ